MALSDLLLITSLSYSSLSCYVDNQLVLQCVEFHWVFSQPPVIYLKPLMTQVSGNNQQVLQCTEWSAADI